MITLTSGCVVWLPFSVQVHLMLHFHLAVTDFLTPNLAPKKFIKRGDITLGALLSFSHYNASENKCNDVLIEIQDVHKAQTLEYAIRQVNTRRVLPRNLNLGLVILDDCFSEVQSTMLSLSFVPQSTCVKTDDYAAQHFDVVGVIGPELNTQAFPVSRLLESVEIPVISFSATNDDLTKYPYFLRTASPDRNQFSTIFYFIKEQNWTYVSLVYQASATGDKGYHFLQNLFEQNKMCLAVVKRISPLSSDKEIQDVANTLWRYQKARVVILVVPRTLAYRVIKETGKRYNKTFVWIGSNAWSEETNYLYSLGELLWGSFVVSQPVSPVKDYDVYFQGLTPQTNKENPWFQDFWDLVEKKQLEEGKVNVLVNYSYTGRFIDLVDIYALAIARIINSCRETNARACVTGPRLKKELLETNFIGKTGPIQFDKDGDFIGKYEVLQLLPSTSAVGPDVDYEKKVVAESDLSMTKILILSKLNWSYHWLSPDKLTPESVCSKPCENTDAVILKVMYCCWDCLPCRPNEHRSNNNTKCSSCPVNTWPDQLTNFTSCRDIPPYTHDMFLPALIIALVFIIVCLSVLVIFYRHRHEIVIRTSALHLSYQMLSAITLGYITIIILSVKPTHHVCQTVYWFFCLSFSFLYGPLLVRSFCIYRIFESGRKSIRRPMLVGLHQQMLLTAGLGFIQVCLCSLEMLQDNKWAELTMRDVTKEYVELSCNLTKSGVTTFLIYNLMMLAVCSFLAYKSRFLPDNFNESRYISLCVSATMLIWSTFIPSYIFAHEESIKTLLVSLALGLSHTVALSLLFLPRVYIVLFRDESTREAGGRQTLASTSIRPSERRNSFPITEMRMTSFAESYHSYLTQKNEEEINVTAYVHGSQTDLGLPDQNSISMITAFSEISAVVDDTRGDSQMSFPSNTDTKYFESDSNSASQWKVQNSGLYTDSNSASQWKVQNSGLYTDSNSASQWKVQNSELYTDSNSASQWKVQNSGLYTDSNSASQGKVQNSGLYTDSNSASQWKVQNSGLYTFPTGTEDSNTDA